MGPIGFVTSRRRLITPALSSADIAQRRADAKARLRQKVVVVVVLVSAAAIAFAVLRCRRCSLLLFHRRPPLPSLSFAAASASRSSFWFARFHIYIHYVSGGPAPPSRFIARPRSLRSAVASAEIVFLGVFGHPGAGAFFLCVFSVREIAKRA